jgi:tRNA pseudouridine38-40 synthase
MRYIIEVSYVGTSYHGWQIQPNANTIQEEIEKAISLVLGEKTPINGSSRTDVGVHARQQFAHFESDNLRIDAKKTTNRLNKLLPKDIAVKNINKVFPEQHTRFDALSRKYIYRITRHKNPFESNISALYPQDFNMELMNSAAELLLKYENFKSFCKVKTEVKTYFCKIEEATWIQNGEVLEFHIKANRFLRGMVRAIVGSLLDVGKGKITITEFEQIILAQDRTKAGNAAKAEGLTLEEVNYPEDYFKNSFEISLAQNSDLQNVKELFIEYQKSLNISLCFQGFEKELESLPEPYDEPFGCILVLKVYEETVGVVALKKLEEGICEMKRLYIKPAYQGFGFGKKMALAIMEQAKAKNYKTMKLDTLERLESAVLLYRNLAFNETQAYNYNPENDILYFEKEL